VALFAIVVGLIAIAVSASVGRRLLHTRREEQAEVQRIRSVFNRYVPESVVEKLLARKDLRVFEGRSTYATILVCRIWNFSQFAEGMSAEETLRYLNEFYALAGTSIQKHHGMIDRFLSDGIVGAFGVPLDDPHQSEHALRAAIDIVRLVDAMRERWAAQGRKPFFAGIGINSGTIIAGDVGLATRRDYMLIGHDVHVARRLQEATNELNAYIVASKRTCDAVSGIFTLVPVSRVPLHGVRGLTDAFIVRGLARNDARDRLAFPRADAFRKTTLETARAAAAERDGPPTADADGDVHTNLDDGTSSDVNATDRPVEAAAPIMQPLPKPRHRASLASPDRPAAAAPSGFYAFDSSEPILPPRPPEAVHATYEDAAGTPFELPT